jgi:type I restriction enzyme, S subunit
MMPLESNQPRAFAVYFKDLHLWSVKSFLKQSWHWPSEFIKPLSTALNRVQEEVNQSEHPFETLQLVTLRFDGTVVPRSLTSSKKFKGRLYFANAGDVIYSRIDVRNGAIGIVPDHMPRVAVTSEFPVYRVKPEQVSSNYIKLLFRTSFFRQTINSMVSGASGRKRVQPSQLNALLVPLPPLSIQGQIVKHWRDSQNEIEDIYKRIEQHRLKLDRGFFNDLSLEAPIMEAAPKCLAVMWKDFSRWGVSYNQAAQTSTDLTQGKYPIVELGSILDSTQYGTSEKANSKGQGVPVLRINNIKDRAIDLTDIKHIKLSEKVIKTVNLIEGDILIIRTSGSRALVGTCAPFHGSGDFVFASYLIRLRVNKTKADSEYISWFINSALGRQQINAVSRQIMMNNINSEELRELQIPLPPLDVQQSIISHIRLGLVEIESEREAATRKARESETELEDVILGKRQVSEAL